MTAAELDAITTDALRELWLVIGALESRLDQLESAIKDLQREKS
jgi:hypothetical protein